MFTFTPHHTQRPARLAGGACIVGASVIVAGVFAAGTVLSAIGFLLVGRATLATGAWHGWRRFTPLATGVWAVALLGLQFTHALPTAVGVYGLCFVAIGVALSTTAPAAA